MAQLYDLDAQITALAVGHGARIDCNYLTASLAPALDRYEQAVTSGSDHQALLLTLSTQAAAGAAAPPPLP